MNTNSPSPIIDAEIAALRLQITQLDVDGKKTRATKTLDEHDAFATAHSTHRLDQSVEGKLLTLRSTHENARADLAGAERDRARINREIDRLVALLTAEDRATLAQQSIDTTTPLFAAAKAAVDAAQAAKAEIQTLIDLEHQALESAKTQAGGALLAQIKAGTKGKLQSVSRERLDTLLLAQHAADAELSDAQIELDTHAADLRQAKDQHAEARADGHYRALYVLSREYAKVLVEAQTAAETCGRYFEAPDLDALARQLQHAQAQGGDD